MALVGEIAGPIGRMIGKRMVGKVAADKEWREQTLARLPGDQQMRFEQIYEERRARLGKAYLFLFLGGLHYSYLRAPLRQTAFWLTLGGMLMWFYIDLMFMYYHVARRNHDIAVQIMQEFFESNYQRSAVGDAPIPSMRV